MMAAVQDLSAWVRDPFEIRIGVHRGRVVVGAIGGAAGTQSVAIGETPNLAARLQAEANPGEIVVSDSLWRLVSHAFHGEPLGARRLKGIQRPVEVHRVISYRPASRYKGSAATFVGRKLELDIFETRWQEVLGGNSRALMIRGEPGIGKSRFIQQLSRNLIEPTTTVVEAGCSAFSTDTAYHPLREMLNNRLRLEGLEPPEQLERLRGRLADLGLPLREALPLLALFLELPIERQEWPILSELSLVRQRQRTLDLLFEGLIALAKQAPVLLIIEDLHWADASTIEFLDQLLGRRFSGRFLILLTARLEFKPRWIEETHVSEIRLDTLNTVDAEAVIRDVAADKAMPSEVMRQICQRASGNTLFLEEITLSVITSKSMVEREQTWELQQPLSADVVPTSMEAALMARLDQLGEGKDLMQIGATLGREFSLDLLTAVVAIDTPRLQELLLQLVDEGLLHISGATPPVYIFKHALVQDVAYNSLLRSTRQQHHSRIAKVLTERFPEIPKRRPELLAHHLSGACRYEEAAHHWHAAGQLAAERNAVNEAVDHLNRGLADLNQLPQEEGRWHHELDLHTALAPVQMAAYGWGSPIVKETCQKAIDLACNLGADDKSFSPLWGLWANQFVAGSLGEAIISAHKVLSLAEKEDGAIYAVPARHATSYTSYYRGDFEAAVQHAAVGLALYNNDAERRMCQVFQLSPTINILTAEASSPWMTGRQREGILGMKKMLEMARSLNHPPTLAAALAFQCFFGFYDQNWLAIKTSAREAVELSATEGFAMWHVCTAMYEAYAEHTLCPAQGNPYKVIEYAKLFRQTGSLGTDCSTTCIMISILNHLGLYEEALRESESGIKTAELGELGVMKSEVLRMRGNTLEALGEMECVREAYRQSLDWARHQGALSLELRCLSSLLINLRSQGQNIETTTMELHHALKRMQSQNGRPEVLKAQNLLTEALL